MTSSGRVINYLSSCHWNTPRKVDSRRDTILEPYRAIFGAAIPPDREYWTMCGGQFVQEGSSFRRIDNGEFGQLFGTGLFTRPQFRGVDRDSSIISHNRALYPGVSWYCGDFLGTMEEAASDGQFNPAIINYDNVQEPPRCADGLRRIVRFLDNNVSHELMLVCNVVLSNPYGRARPYTPEEVTRELFYRKGYAFADHWSVLDHYYEYRGGASDQSKCRMGTFIFVKQPHRSIYRTPGRRLDFAIDTDSIMPILNPTT